MQHNKIVKRSAVQKIVDFITFPIRALTLIEDDKWGFSSLRSERFDYCAQEVQGYCLDIGCGKNNWFITHYLSGNGEGLDIYPYEGLDHKNLVDDFSHFPYEDESFDTVTFIANLNHIPEPMRDIELQEAYRCLKPQGNIVATMGLPFVELLAHGVVWVYDKLLGTNYDMDHVRGMEEDESYYIPQEEIIERLSQAGFGNIKIKRFWTQWGLNAMFIGRKPS